VEVDFRGKVLICNDGEAIVQRARTIRKQPREHSLRRRFFTVTSITE